MEGLLNKAQVAAGGAPAPQAVSPEMGPEEEGLMDEGAEDTEAGGNQPAPAGLEQELTSEMEEATPEEQEAFERARAVGLKLLSAKGALDRLINSVRKNGLDCVAESIAMMVVQIDEKMDLPETTILPVATELSGFVMDAVNRSKVARVDEKAAQQVLGKVYQALATAYGQTAEDAQEALGDVGGMGDEQPEPEGMDEMSGNMAGGMETSDGGTTQ